MDYLYLSLLVIHISSAIFGVGPVFLFNMILRRAKTVDQLRYAHHIVEKLNKNANLSFGILLVTGLILGWMSPYLFRQMWYIASIVLFLISGFYALLVVEPILKRLHQIARQSTSAEVSQEYKQLFQKKQARDMLANLMAIAIILLMIIKPVF